MLRAGDRIEALIEKPAAGGRMIARHEGQIVLVAGAIPGERVTARIDRVDKRLAFASTADVLAPSPDRRSTTGDPACGGCLFSHIAVARQRALKGEIVADAFTRIAKHVLPDPITIAASPAEGYRMRARLHVREGRIGFYREGTHELCNAADTGQLHTATLPVVQRLVDGLRAQALEPVSVEVAESIASDQRAVEVEVAGSRAADGHALQALLDPEMHSIAVVNARGVRVSAGPGVIVEALATVTRGA